MIAEAGLADVPEGSSFDGLREKLRLIRREVNNAQRQQRQIIASMRNQEQAPSEAAALLALLRARAEYWSYASGWTLSFEEAGIADPLPQGVARHLGPILEEALANIAAHARASSVRISLAAGLPGAPPDPLATTRALTLTVVDDGVGGAWADSANTNGSGLNGMRDRVRALGGRLTVDSPPERGTTITVEVSGPPQRPTVPDTAPATVPDTQRPGGRTP